jgi:hypothetical protein
VPALSVGALDMHDVAFKLVAMNIQIDDQRIVGLLGYDLLASGIFGIDFKNRTLTLYSPEAFRSESAGMLPIPAQLDDEVPRVPVKVGGVDGSFLFDTGAFATLVYKHYLAKLPDARNEDVGEGSIAVVGGSVATKVYQIPAMIFGPVRFAPSDVVVPQTSTFDTVDYDGILGRNFLATFAAYLDYADRTIYIDPQP